MTLRPFFSFYGSKWRSARSHAPPPAHPTIIEPFAGSAGYSTRYYDRDVRLFDKDEKVCGVWDFLIHSTESEIRRLPSTVDHVDDLSCPQEAKWLIGFWLNHGTTRPSLSPSAWMRKGTHASSFWGDEIKERVAVQSSFISHWTITHGAYLLAINQEATWYVDPPYQKAGKHYVHSSRDLDFQLLSRWCMSRKGQVIVCENKGADWLPFGREREIKSTLGTSKEVLWMKEA